MKSVKPKQLQISTGRMPLGGMKRIPSPSTGHKLLSTKGMPPGIKMPTGMEPPGQGRKR